MRKNLSIEREFEREIIDHQAFLRDEEERAQLEWEMECEWDDCGLTPEDEELIEIWCLRRSPASSGRWPTIVLARAASARRGGIGGGPYNPKETA